MEKEIAVPASEITKTYVYGAVRCVGALKPVFDPQQNGFLPPELTVVFSARPPMYTSSPQPLCTA